MDVEMLPGQQSLRIQISPRLARQQQSALLSRLQDLPPAEAGARMPVLPAHCKHTGYAHVQCICVNCDIQCAFVSTYPYVLQYRLAVHSSAGEQLCGFNYSSQTVAVSRIENSSPKTITLIKFRLSSPVKASRKSQLPWQRHLRCLATLFQQ